MPTRAALRDLAQHIARWRDKITTGLLAVLEAYEVVQSDAFAMALEAYQSRGATRALDILLEGRFQDFFALPVEKLSYGAAALSGLAQAANDAAKISSRNRVQATRSIRRIAADSPDYEVDTSDTELAVRPDPPSALFAPDVVDPDA